MTPRCPECGTELQQATIDVSGTPEVDPDVGRDVGRDVDPDVDRPRAEFDAQHMAAVSFCPNPDCPRHGRPEDAEDAGARL